MHDELADYWQMLMISPYCRGILAQADGVVLSRGNLGLDVQPEKMALVQKQIVQVKSLYRHCRRQRWRCDSRVQLLANHR